MPNPQRPGTGALRRDAAFTMVEIALCLAIVGFALVAIIGVLPAGLNVQKENREETIINQDASVWLDALRSGGSQNSSGYDELTKYVDRISVSQHFYDAGGTFLPPSRQIVGSVGGLYGGFSLTNGARIVGLLSTPRIYADPDQTGNPGGYVSNYVVAYVRAFSGSAVEKPPQDNADVKDLAFSYRLVAEVTPLGGIFTNGVTPPWGVFDYARIQTSATDYAMAANFNDVRLLFRWPLQRALTVSDPEPPTGNSRMVFRTQLSGKNELNFLPGLSGTPFFFIQSGEYQP